MNKLGISPHQSSEGLFQMRRRLDLRSLPRLPSARTDFFCPCSLADLRQQESHACCGAFRLMPGRGVHMESSIRSCT